MGRLDLGNSRRLLKCCTCTGGDVIGPVTRIFRLADQVSTSSLRMMRRV